MVIAASIYKVRRALGWAFLGLGLMIPCHSYAQSPLTPINMAPLSFKGLYEFGFGGLRFGQMGVEIDQKSNHYTMESDIISTGLMKLFVNHTSHTTVEASGADFSYPDRQYETHYQTKKKKKYARLIYKNNVLTQEQVLPPDNRAVRPAVPAELKNNATDPLSLVLALRVGLFKALKDKRNDFVVNVYDGRRLTQVHFTVQGQKILPYNKRRVPVIQVDATRRLVAGFTASELADHDPREPVLHIYVSDDARLIPLRLEARAWMGLLSASLVNECRAGESCLLGIKE